MADNGSELRSIAWTQVFPFLRLFRTFKLTLNLSSLLFGLAAVLGCYLGGRILDGIWLCAGSGVTVAADGQESEVQAYAGRSVDKFVDWKTETQGARQQRVLAAAVALGNAENETEARQKLEQQSATKLLRSKSQEDQVQKALRLVDTYLDGARRAVGKDDKLSADAKRRSREELEHAADSLRLIFTGHSGRGFAPLTDPTHALSLLSAAAGGELTPAQREGEAAANRALATQIDLNGLKDSAPRGPFITLLR
jgi:hypothetical protein